MAIYHCHVATGSRKGGQSASAKIYYLIRGGSYARGADEVVHIEARHMPAWAQDEEDARLRDAAMAYWQAADRHERRNARLYKHVQVALPIELGFRAQIALLRVFATELASHGIEGGVLPVTFTVHRGQKRNMHSDIVLSERINDGIARSPSLWFRRAAPRRQGKPANPASGGARKTTTLKRREWLQWVRRRWADLVNAALATHGCTQRVDHRALAAQGRPEIPQIHVGYRSAALARRGLFTPRWLLNEAIIEVNRRRARLARDRERAQREEAQEYTTLLQLQWRIEQEQLAKQVPRMRLT